MTQNEAQTRKKYIDEALRRSGWNKIVFFKEGRIYEKGDPNDAEDICNTYGRRGLHFLKPVWEEHQKGKGS